MTATLAGWRGWSPEAKAELRTRLTTELRRRSWRPYPWQRPPGPIPAHGTWLLMGGRGTGKTEGAARYTLDHVNGPPCDPRLPGGHRIAVVGPTQGDAVESFVNGPSGLVALNPGVRGVTTTGGYHVRFPGGAEGKVFGAHSPDDVQRLRAGGNRCLVVLEEAAAMRYLAEAREQTAMGLRIGPTPHYVVSSTPRPLPAFRALHDEATYVTTGRTADATHLAPEVLADLVKKYGGTRLGRQELDAEFLDDTEGALWRWNMFTRVEAPTELRRIVVAVDPAVSAKATSDETGIVVVGAGGPPEWPLGYVLADYSGRFTVETWARRVVEVAALHGADTVIAEVNNGGDLVGTVMRDRGLSVRQVRASRGKFARAEPVAMLYEQGRVAHVGMLPHLEDQLTTWVPGEGRESPDRLDALVWGLTELLLTRTLAPVRSFAT